MESTSNDIFENISFSELRNPLPPTAPHSQQYCFYRRITTESSGQWSRTDLGESSCGKGQPVGSEFLGRRIDNERNCIVMVEITKMIARTECPNHLSRRYFLGEVA